MKTLILILSLVILQITITAQTEPIRGVWLTNVDSDVLRSRERITEAVQLCEESGINTIYVVTWNKGYTLYPSRIMDDLIGVNIYPDYAGRDPLKDLIEEAHARKIRVIAWFEFGFASSYNLNGGHLLKLKPEWKGIDSKGKLVSKNNFEWMNAFLPEVQDFMLSLILEVVRNYDIDGIQGDDRLPAMPCEGGYDEYTVSLYQNEHNGKKPPEDFRDKEWIQWRANLLTEYMGKIYQSVKSIKKDVIISMAPSIHPWGRDEYLQDWMEWVKRGYVEQIIPQLYRYDITAYRKLLDNVVSEQISKENFKLFYPGVLLKVGSYYAKEEFLKEIIELNRKYGIKGEVFFFYEGIKKYPEFFKNQYKNY